MDQIIENLGIALNALVAIIDWVYVLVFILCAFIALKYAGESLLKKSISIKIRTKKIVLITAKRLIVLITAILLAIAFGLFYWRGSGFPWHPAGQVAYSLTIFFSMLMAIFINEFFNIEKLLNGLLNISKKVLPKKAE